VPEPTIVDVNARAREALSEALDPHDFEIIKKTDSRKELDRVLKKIFAAVNTDNSGYLDRKEIN
jgi:predicted acetyltransferase